MPGEAKQKTIGDITYRMEPLGADTGQKVLKRIFRAVGTIQTTGDVGRAIGDLTDNDLEFITSRFAESTTYELPDPNPRNGIRQVKLSSQYNHVFAAKYENLYAFLEWGIEVNFASFFADLVARQNAAGDPASISQTTPTSSSGDSSPATG